MIALTDEDLLEAVSAGEMTEKITKSHERVAVVLTQSWCPQWLMMKIWLNGMKGDFKIYWAEYEKMDCYHAFMNFKEKTFGNYQVPYIRFYVNGELTGESNYCNREHFLNQLGV